MCDFCPAGRFECLDLHVVGKRIDVDMFDKGARSVVIRVDCRVIVVLVEVLKRLLETPIVCNISADLDAPFPSFFEDSAAGLFKQL